MKKKLTTVMFKGTKEQELRLLKVIDEHKDDKGATMPILQEAQEIYGYLPIEVQRIVADNTGIPLAEIYGIVTFYSQFLLNPKGKYAIGVCMGTACYVRGSGDILAEICKRLNLPKDGSSPDGKFSIEETRCIGACGLAPVITINEDVYGRLTKDEIAGILEKYKD